MKTGWSERVREVADKAYVQPARRDRTRIKIRFGDLRARMAKLGFPPGHFNQIATPLEAAKFWEPRGLEMCTPKGQRRNDDTVFEFRFVEEPPPNRSERTETSRERARRIGEEMFGMMKEKIAAHGGTEGYIRWVRSRDEDESAV